MTRLRGAEKRTPLLALDLVGTIIHGPDEMDGRFVNTATDVTVFGEAIELMRRWKHGGGRIVVVSNQGGVAMGHMTMDDCVNIMGHTYQRTGRTADKVAFCVHHPAAADPEMARCWCRKPSPGLLVEAALDLAAKHGEYYPPYLGLFVGDRPEDEECARLAGFDFQWAKDWRAQA